jgi:hypothetical protein
MTLERAPFVGSFRPQRTMVRPNANPVGTAVSAELVKAKICRENAHSSKALILSEVLSGCHSCSLEEFDMTPCANVQECGDQTHGQ